MVNFLILFAYEVQNKYYTPIPMNQTPKVHIFFEKNENGEQYEVEHLIHQVALVNLIFAAMVVGFYLVRRAPLIFADVW